MLASVIRNYVIILVVVVGAVVVLRDNTTLFDVGQTARQAVQRSVVESGGGLSEEEMLRRGDTASEDRDPGPETPGQMVIQAGPGGHYYVDADIDGYEIGFLVDTGASMVALSVSDAETLGLPVHQLDYSGRANTANGVARFAPVILKQISVGEITIYDVQAVVMEVPMAKSLLGMSFLSRLEGFEVRDNRLIMRW